MSRLLRLAAVVALAVVGCGDNSGGAGNLNANNDNGSSTVLCGDGNVDGPEACDDGAANSDTEANACRTDCTLARCGDGVIDTNEACDEGASNSDELPDACRTDCVEPGCGDGVVDVQTGETCDPGEPLPTATCSTDCGAIYCGNGVLNPGEVCDDGNLVAGDGCSPDCLSHEICGNGIVDVESPAGGEACDDGAGNSDTVPDVCRADCSRPWCGDGVVDNLEVCDEAAANSDAVDATCRLDCQPARCGDYIVDSGSGEVCDDGNNVTGDGCSGDCFSDETCGNGVVDGLVGEECDDGTANSDTAADACRVDCVLPFCGDGIIDSSEACDDATTNSDASDALCRLNCQDRRCGDGIIDPALGEVCDDGNLVSGDGCSGDCLSRETCGNGYVDFALGEQCDDGDHQSHDGCHSSCHVELLAWEEAQELAVFWHIGHRMVYDSERGVVVMFGGGFTGDQYQDTWEYDGLSWSDTTPAVSPPGRQRTAMAYVPTSGKTVLFGGGVSNSVIELGDTWEYDGITWQEVGVSTSPSDRSNHAMAYDAARDVVVLFGGQGGAAVVRGDTWAYDGSDWTQITPATSSPSPRMDSSMTWSPAHGGVVLFGGSGLGDTWLWDGNDWSQLPIAAPAAVEVKSHRMVTDWSGSRVVLHGYVTSGSVDSSVTYALDGAGWVDLAPAADPGPVTNYDMAYDENRNRVVLFGGVDGNDYAATWEFDGTDWVGNQTQKGPGNRAAIAMAFDPARGRTVIFGGPGYSYSDAGDTWEHDGTRWIRRTPATRPVNRFHAKMVFDAARSVIVMCGGSTVAGVITNETWEWDGVDWTAGPAIPWAAPRYGLAMAYDADRQRVVLFGGSEGGLPTVYRDETWEYDGVSWVQASPTGVPDPRAFHAMGYDPLRRRVVLFGGDAASGALDDLWEYDGTTWTQVSIPNGPSPRSSAQLAWDPSTERMMLFAGHRYQSGEPTIYLDDLWEYNGTDWTYRQPLGWQPLARYYFGWVYDTWRQRFLLLGGVGESSYFDDTWYLEYLSTWPAEICDDGVDNDFDGAVDCVDPDCAIRFPCLGCGNMVVSAGEACDDGPDTGVGACLNDCSAPCAAEADASLAYLWTGNGNALDIVGQVPADVLGDVGYGGGRVDQAFSFPNPATVSNSVMLPHDVLHGRSDFTVTLWLKTAAGGRAILSGASVAEGQNAFLIFDPANLVVVVNGVWYTFGASIDDDAWHLVTVTYVDGLVTLDIDGGATRLTNDFGAQGAVVIDAGALYLGQEQDCPGGCLDSAQAFEGLMDEISVYAPGLTAAEIQILYTQGAAGTVLCQP